MKIRTDFVSNSSSSSFICYLKHKDSISKYINLFDNLLGQSINSPNLFKYVVIDFDIVKEDQDLLSDIRECSEDDLGETIISDLNWKHDLELDDTKDIVINFREYLFLYMKTDKKDMLKSAIKMFISEDCWEDNAWTPSECFSDLRDFLDKFSIKYQYETAHV